MNKIKYKKGDIVREDWSNNTNYLYEVIKDIPLTLWKKDYIGNKFVRALNSTIDSLSDEETIIECNLKQYKVSYMNTALYKILYKGESIL